MFTVVLPFVNKVPNNPRWEQKNRMSAQHLPSNMWMGVNEFFELLAIVKLACLGKLYVSDYFTECLPYF